MRYLVTLDDMRTLESDSVMMEHSISGDKTLLTDSERVPVEHVLTVTEFFRRPSDYAPFCLSCPFWNAGRCTTKFRCAVKAWHNGK